MWSRALSVAVVLGVLGMGAPARADAIGIRPCTPGGHPVRNPHHGMGWCEASPCETDVDCQPSSRLGVGAGGPATPFCRVVGVCTWTSSPTRLDAIGSCETEGVACGGPSYSDGGVCHVRGHCVTEDEAAGLPLPGEAPPTSPVPPTEPPIEPTPPPVVVAPPPPPPPPAPVTPAPDGGCGCRADSGRSPSIVGLVLVAGLVVRRRARRILAT